MMQLLRNPLVILLFAMVMNFAPPVYAQLCFNESLDQFPWGCSDAQYFARDPDGDPEVQDVFGLNTGTNKSSFDLKALFDPLNTPQNLSGANSRSDAAWGRFKEEWAAIFQQKGTIEMSARESDEQFASWGNISIYQVTPVMSDNSIEDVLMKLTVNVEAVLEDPVENAGVGGVEFASDWTITRSEVVNRGTTNPLHRNSGFASLDLADSPTPRLVADFSSADVEQLEPETDDKFRISISFEETYSVTPGEKIAVELKSYGGIFTDGFESGDVSDWKSSSKNTITLLLSSDDPNVRFEIDGLGPFFINAGLNDAWVHAGAPYQGMFVTVFPFFKLIFAAWFTFDIADTAEKVFRLMSAGEGGISPKDATVGASDQRWITALGSYIGNSATLKAEMTTGGRFNSNEGDPQQDTNYGTINLNFNDCNSADVEYDFPGPEESGSFTMNRVLQDNVKICEGIVSGDIVPETESNAEKAQRYAAMVKGQEYRTESAAFTINSGLNDSWVNPLAGFQGMFLTVFPDFGLIFAAWFTFDSESQDGEEAKFGAADQRWLTALGTYSGTTANLKIENTTGGAFNSDALTPVQDTEYGTATIEFSDCNDATVTFEIPSAGQSGEFNINRVLGDNVGLCTALSAQ